MKADISPKHEFAIYVEKLTQTIASVKLGATVRFDDEELFHRVVHVLRIQAGQTVMLFDEAVHAQFTFEQGVGKKSVAGVLVNKSPNKMLAPTISVLLPLLKREAFDEAIYSCVELGANTIELVVTAKTQRAFGGDKELQRMRNVMIAAAEQSKQFALPTIFSPVPLEQALAKFKQPAQLICCDSMGDPLMQLLEQFVQQQPKHVALIVGPEGDFTELERELLMHNNARRVLLTPTVLRAQQALVVALGALRSVCR